MSMPEMSNITLYRSNTAACMPSCSTMFIKECRMTLYLNISAGSEAIRDDITYAM